MTNVRVRFAPSPTGFLHIGGARTALFNWLYARRNGGSFILRMEDTDRERSTEASVKAILDGLKWLSIDWDEGPEADGDFGPYFQTQRLDTYKQVADKLIAEGKAYRCYCTTEEIQARRAIYEKEKRTYKYEGTCRERTEPVAGRTSIVRFKMPAEDGAVTFDDRVLGRISKQIFDLDDWVMMRADGIPLYNFGCVVDDHLMEITLVVRGQEHVNSTFPQLMLYRAMGWEPPQFAHLPLILAPDRKKLSKRLHDDADVMNHQKNGILPDALNNYIVRLGWSHGNDEVISRAQMIEWFDFAQVGSTSGVWDPEKLHWLNQQYMKMMAPAELASRLVPFLQEQGLEAKADERLEKLVVLMRERTRTLVEMAKTARYFFTRGVTLDEKAAAKHLNADGLAVLQKARTVLGEAKVWQAAELDALLKGLSETLGVGMGKVAQPIRVALTGNTTSPGIGETLELIGEDEALLRLDEALKRAA